MSGLKRLGGRASSSTVCCRFESWLEVLDRIEATTVSLVGGEGGIPGGRRKVVAVPREERLPDSWDHRVEACCDEANEMAVGDEAVVGGPVIVVVDQSGKDEEKRGQKPSLPFRTRNTYPSVDTERSQVISAFCGITLLCFAGRRRLVWSAKGRVGGCPDKAGRPPRSTDSSFMAEELSIERSAGW